MKDISLYFTPREKQNTQISESISEKIISHTENYFPDLSKNNIAIFSCEEYRKANQENETNFDSDDFLTELEKLHFGDS